MHPFLCEALTEGDTLDNLIGYYGTAGRSELAAAGRAFRDGGYRRVAFAGMGSSYCAPFAVVDYLIANGIPTVVSTAHKLARERAVLLTPDTFVVGISKSGTTRELLDLASGMSDRSGLIGLINQQGSPLAAHCAVVLPMGAGTETQIASKSYLCTLAVLNLLAAEIAGTSSQNTLDALHSIAAWACVYISNVERIRESWLATLVGCAQADVMGSGSSYSTAYKSALVLREVPRVTAAAIDCADYAHGWAKIVRHGYVGIIFAPKHQEHSAEARAMAQIQDRGGHVILITSTEVPARGGLTVIRHPVVPDSLAPLAQAVICDMMIGTLTDIQSR